MLLASTSALAANFTIIEETRHGNWRSVLYENDNGSRRFCALESVSQTPTFRLNSYLQNNDTFLEIYDPSWSKLEGKVRFGLRFEVPKHGMFEMSLTGQSWGDSYTYDILETETFGSLQGLLASGTRLEIVNSNGAALASYSLKGSKAALTGFNACKSG